jgi:hypothetical protein
VTRTVLIAALRTRPTTEYGVASSWRWVQPLRIESDLCPFSKMRAVAGGSRMSDRRRTTGSVTAPRKFFADGYAAGRAAFSPGYYFEQQSKRQHRDHLQPMPNCNADLLSVAQRQRGTCNPCFLAVNQEERPSHDKATGVIGCALRVAALADENGGSAGDVDTHWCGRARLGV